MHFMDHKIIRSPIFDKVFERQRTVNNLVFLVDRLNGSEADTRFSVVSQRLMQDLSGYLPGKAYRTFEFTIIKDSAGYVPPRIVRVKPYAGS